MNQNLKLLSVILVIGIFVLVFVVVGLFIRKEIVLDSGDEGFNINLGGQANEPKDVFGTTSGTSTTPVSNLGTAGYPSDWPNSDFSDVSLNESGYPTTSKVMMLDGQVTDVLMSFTPIAASSSSYFSYDIFGTNDNYATTTATSTTDDNYDSSGTIPIQNEINWYDIGTDGSRISGSLDMTGESPTNATGTSRFLANVGWKFLRVDLRGASTTVGVQMREVIK